MSELNHQQKTAQDILVEQAEKALKGKKFKYTGSNATQGGFEEYEIKFFMKKVGGDYSFVIQEYGHAVELDLWELKNLIEVPRAKEGQLAEVAESSKV